MKTPILAVSVTGVLLACLGGCRVSTAPSAEEPSPGVAEGAGTTGDTPSVAVPAEATPAPSANQPGPAEPIPPLYDWPATPSNSSGASDSDTADAESPSGSATTPAQGDTSLPESNCSDPLNYVDTYNSGWDAPSPPGPVQTVSFGSANARRGQTFSLADPNDASVIKKDYDWYEFQISGGYRRFKVQLHADFPSTWEIWPADDGAAGPIEGVDVPPSYDAGIFTRRCYAIGTYWLRVYATGGAACGSDYQLALIEPDHCWPCTFAGMSDLDDPCDDVTAYDTNAGCDDPSAPPPHYMSFSCGQSYWGRIYAGLQGNLPYYDADWFTFTNTDTNDRRLRLAVVAEFVAQVEVYLSCNDYNAGNPVPGLFGVTPLVVCSVCPTTLLTATTGAPPGTVFYGRITCVDQLGNVMTKYFPCAQGNNRWKVLVDCIE